MGDRDRSRGRLMGLQVLHRDLDVLAALGALELDARAGYLVVRDTKELITVSAPDFHARACLLMYARTRMPGHEIPMTENLPSLEVLVPDEGPVPKTANLIYCNIFR